MDEIDPTEVDEIFRQLKIVGELDADQYLPNVKHNDPYNDIKPLFTQIQTYSKKIFLDSRTKCNRVH
jgi:hypothetical protein